MQKIFNPGTVAIFGASNNESRVGYSVMKNVIGSGYEGIVYPINLKRKSIFGIRAYRSLTETGDKIDLAIVATPVRTIVSVVRHCGKNNVPGVVIVSPGFDESDSQSQEIITQIVELSNVYNIRVIGLNSLGFINPSVKLNLSFANKMALPGNIAFVSESNSICNAFLDWSLSKGVGFSHFISIGSMIDVGYGDLIDYLNSDSQTYAIVIYMESITGVRNFMSAVRACVVNKPIIVLKSGKKSDTLTGAMSDLDTIISSQVAFEAAFKRGGIISVDTLRQLFSLSDIISKQPIPKGNRLAIVTNACGIGVLTANYLVREGGDLASLSKGAKAKLDEKLEEKCVDDNSIYVLSEHAEEEFGLVSEACLQEDNVDAVLVIISSNSSIDKNKIAHSINEVSKTYKKTVLVSCVGSSEVADNPFDSIGIPMFITPEKAITAFIDLVKYNTNLRLLQETPPEIPIRFEPKTADNKKLIEEVLAEGRMIFNRGEAKRFLENYQIPVVKNLGKDHKGDHNINVEVANDKFELIIGARKDDLFGPIIVFGMGGTMFDVYQDFSFGLPPLNMAQTRRIIEDTKIYKILKGYKGVKGVDIEKLQFLLYEFSHLVADFPEIKELIINPYSVDCELGAALDAKVVLDSSITGNEGNIEPFSHLVIAPCPDKYTYNYTMRDGTDVLIRPIKAEDEPLERDMFSYFSRETQYFRFMGYIKDTTHDMIVKFTNIDYDREMALVAEINRDGRRKMIGVVRIVNDIGNEATEYAIVVADPWQGKGLGSELTNRIMDIAKDRGIKKVYANVLKSNTTMLEMFKSRNFKIDVLDSTTYRVWKEI